MSYSPSSFSGAIPEMYQRYRVPVIFEPFAADLAERAEAAGGLRWLETACGTGAVTRRLAERLFATRVLVATDLSPGMLAVASGAMKPDPRVTFREADALALPFPDASFDLVVCQFGVMFFPDKLAGFREAKRVLAPGGHFLFSVWESIERNPFSLALHATVQKMFAQDPPQFCFTPFGYHDSDLIRAQLAEARFHEIRIEKVEKPAVSPSARAMAVGMVKGSPLSLAITERGGDLAAVEREVATALAAVGGVEPFRAPMRAQVVTASA